MAKTKGGKQQPQRIRIKNKRATFDFEVIDTYTAGIVLTGTEIKSIRAGKASWSILFASSTTESCG